jgi:hypothetical protein
MWRSVPQIVVVVTRTMTSLGSSILGTRRRWAIGTGLGVVSWLLISAAAAASGVLARSRW